MPMCNRVVTIRVIVNLNHAYTYAFVRGAHVSARATWAAVRVLHAYVTGACVT